MNGVAAVRRRVGSGGGGDAGQVLLLGLAYGLLALALVLLIASAAAVHLERTELLALADAAALDAADALDAETFYTGAGGAVVPLTDDGVRAAVAEHLASSPGAAGLTGLAVAEPTGTSDGRTAQVTLTAVARPPFLPWGVVLWSDGIPLRVTSAARAG